MRMQAISQMTRETATMAFCLPRRRAYPPVLLAEAGIGPGRGHHALAERAAQVGVALAGAARPGAVPRLEGARGQPGPRGGVPGGGEHRHVGAELGDEDPGVAHADPGDLIEPCHQAQHGRAVAGAAGRVPAAGQPAARARPAPRQGWIASCCSILSSRRVISSLIVSMSRRCVAISKAWISRNRPVSAAASCWRVALQPPVPQRGQRGRASFPGDQGLEEPPPAGAEQVGDHHGDLQQGVLEDLLDPVLVPDLVLGQPGPGAGSATAGPGSGSGGTNERRSIPRSFSLHSHTQSSRSILPRPGRCLTSRALTSHTSRPAASAR